MSLHVTLPRPHRPTLAEVRMVGSYAAAGASAPTAVLAVGAGLVWPTVAFAAAVLGAVVGSRGSGRRWRRRLDSLSAENDRNNRAVHLQLADHERWAAEQFNAWSADRSRWADLNDSRIRSGAGQPNKGYR